MLLFYDFNSFHLTFLKGLLREIFALEHGRFIRFLYNVFHAAFGILNGDTILFYFFTVKLLYLNLLNLRWPSNRS
jgi:hypothetical protein